MSLNWKPLEDVKQKDQNIFPCEANQGNENALQKENKHWPSKKHEKEIVLTIGYAEKIRSRLSETSQ